MRLKKSMPKSDDEQTKENTFNFLEPNLGRFRETKLRKIQIQKFWKTREQNVLVIVAVSFRKLSILIHYLGRGKNLCYNQVILAHSTYLYTNFG